MSTTCTKNLTWNARWKERVNLTICVSIQLLASWFTVNFSRVYLDPEITLHRPCIQVDFKPYQRRRLADSIWDTIEGIAGREELFRSYLRASIPEKITCWGKFKHHGFMIHGAQLTESNEDDNDRRDMSYIKARNSGADCVYRLTCTYLVYASESYKGG
jgi:hypothetical protein